MRATLQRRHEENGDDAFGLSGTLRARRGSRTHQCTRSVSDLRRQRASKPKDTRVLAPTAVWPREHNVRRLLTCQNGVRCVSRRHSA